MRIILTALALLPIGIFGQTVTEDFDKNFLFTDVDTLHIYSKITHRNNTIRFPLKNLMLFENSEFYPSFHFYMDKEHKYHAYLMVAKGNNFAVLIITENATNKIVFSDIIAKYELLEGAYEKWQNAWIADFNNDTNLDIGIYKQLIDFELPNNESKNISADEKYLLTFNDGKLQRKSWNFNIFKKYQLLPNQNKMKLKEITIIGTALNAKLGAIIQTENGEVYYLAGVYEWPDDITGKKVKATGTISSEYHDPKNLKTKDGAYKTGMSGEKVNLHDVVWEVIE
jgi:hypothetical protein